MLLHASCKLSFARNMSRSCASVQSFLKSFEEKLQLKTFEDWNSITKKQIISNGGNSIINNYTLYQLKCIGYPKGTNKFQLKPKKIKQYWMKKENIEEFLKKIEIKYNFKTKEDWNTLSVHHIRENKGSSILRYFSIFELKLIGFPEGKEFFLQSKQKGFWDKHENIEDFLVQLKKKLNLNTFDDWNLLTIKKINDNGGNVLRNKFPIHEIKSIGFPEGKSKFSIKKSQGFWKNKENIKIFLKNIEKELNFQKPEDWNKISVQDIINFGGRSILKKYSLFELKCLACPDCDKEIFSKPNKPNGFWYNKDNVNDFLIYLKEKLNLNSFDDWNSLSSKQIIENGGNYLISNYSMYDIKCLGFPEGKSKFDKNSRNSIRYWKKYENIQQFLDDLGKKLNLKTPEDWNLFSAKQLKENGGTGLLKYYSMAEIRSIACPEGNPLYSVPNKPKSNEYWNDKDNINNFIINLKEKYNINTTNDWKRLSINQINKSGGSGLLKKYKKISDLNVESIPDDINSSGLTGRSSQRWLFLQVQKLFPGEEIIEDYFHSDISRESGFAVQFDVFLVDKKIAIEYHGKQHYEDIPSSFAPIELYQQRDEEKEKLCKKYGINLIIIPYWWDNSEFSLKQTINSKIREGN